VPVEVKGAVIEGGGARIAVLNEGFAAQAMDRGVLADQGGDVDVPVGMIMREVLQDRGQLDGVAQAVTELDQDACAARRRRGTYVRISILTGFGDVGLRIGIPT
jgi:hypothetical protein